MKLNIQLFAEGEIIIPIGLDDDNLMDDLKALKGKISKEEIEAIVRPQIEEKAKEEVENNLNRLMELIQEYKTTANSPIQFGNISTKSLKELKIEIDEVVRNLEK